MVRSQLRSLRHSNQATSSHRLRQANSNRFSQVCRMCSLKPLHVGWVIQDVSQPMGKCTAGDWREKSLEKPIRTSYLISASTRDPSPYLSATVLKGIQAALQTPNNEGNRVQLTMVVLEERVRHPAHWLKTSEWVSTSRLLCPLVATCTHGEWMTRDNSESIQMFLIHLNRWLFPALRAPYRRLFNGLTADLNIVLS